jgi:hypothetical protein
MTVPVLSSIITSHNYAITGIVHCILSAILVMQICQYGNPGKKYITGKKITLTKMKAIFFTDTIRGITSNVNVSVW